MRMDKYLKQPPCISMNFELPIFAYMNIFGMRTMILCHRNDKKKKSKVCFVEINFGQKVWSTFPVAQYRIASRFKNGANVVCL